MLQGLGSQGLGQARAAIVWMVKQVAIQYDTGEFDLVLSRVTSVRPPKAESGQRLGNWLTITQTNALFRGSDKLEKSNPARAARNQAILVLSVVCGLRRDEIVSSCWSDLHRQGDNMVLSVHGKGEKLRPIKIPSVLEPVLQKWRQHQLPETTHMFTSIRRGGHVTKSAMTGQSVWDIVRDTADKAGIGKIAPHDLRRTFARQAYEHGATMEEIRQSMGHEHISTTERYVNAVMRFDHTASDVVAETLEKAKKKQPAAQLPPIAADTPLTRTQAAERLGISVSQFDRLKKQHHLKRVYDLTNDPITNASTRPFNVYKAAEVDALWPDAQRLRKNEDK